MASAATSALAPTPSPKHSIAPLHASSRTQIMAMTSKAFHAPTTPSPTSYYSSPHLHFCSWLALMGAQGWDQEGPSQTGVKLTEHFHI